MRKSKQEGFYLARRKTKNGGVLLYAVQNVWDEKKKKQVKKAQIYLGRVGGNKPNRFNTHANEYVYLFRQTEYEKPFYQWQDFCAASETKPARLEAEPNDAAATTATVVTDPLVDKVDDCVSLAAGIGLLGDKIVETVGLRDPLEEVFGECLTDQILSLAYYCASESRSPLYSAAAWSEDQKLPGGIHLSEKDISETLRQISASNTLSFLRLWLKRCPREDRLSLDITSVSSYARHNPDVMPGYNRDQEKLPQINLLLMTDQKTKLPVWFEQLPGAISDMTTVKDTVQLLKQLDDTPRNIVCDRGFASMENIACLQKNGFKFTVGLPLHHFKEVREIIKQAADNHEFSVPGQTLDLFDDFKDNSAEAVTKKVVWNKHRVYLHLYYCSSYKSDNEDDLMRTINRLQKLLESGKEPTSKTDLAIVQECFTVKETPKRGRKVTCNGAAVDKLKQECGGYFAIASNQFKDAREALYAYRMRDGVEKRFDDLKNEEDCKRLRVHSAERTRARLFIQFIAEILRCYVINEKQLREKEWKEEKLRPKTINDIMRAMASLRYIHIMGHHHFYKRPTKTQMELLRFFKIDTSNRLSWPSLHPSLKN